MHRSLAWIALAATAGQSAAQVIPAPSVGSPIVVRAVRDDLSPTLTQWLAENAEPTRFTPSKFPDLPAQTAEEVAAALCGRSDESYWSAFKSENDLPQFEPRERLGSRAFEFKWPACFYVRRGDFAHTVRDKESAALVYARETGSGGKPRTYNHFFSASKIPKLSSIDVGDVLRFPFRTQSVTIFPRGDADTFKARLESLASGEAKFSDNIVRTAEPPPAPLDGEVVLDARYAGEIASAASTPVDCDGRGGVAFDIDRASAAFGYKPLARSDEVHVVVVDNGFFALHVRMEN